MKEQIITIIAILIFATSCSKGWENVSEGTDPEGGKFIVSIDRSDITDFGDKKTAWIRKSFANPKKLKDGQQYQETYVFFAVNCKEKKYSVIQIGMSNPNTHEFVHTVKFTDDEDKLVWKDVPADDMSQKIYGELCIWYKSII